MSSWRSGPRYLRCVQRLPNWGACSMLSEGDIRIFGPAMTMLATAFLLLLTGCERNTLDRQMEELCQKDGGAKVYEAVTLPASYFEHDGRLRLGPPLALGVSSPAESAKFRRVGDDEFRVITTRKVLVGVTANPAQGGGQLIRLHWAAYRWPDRKLLGEQVEYRRIGGDGFTFGFQPSSASCPRVERGVEQLVFVKEA